MTKQLFEMSFAEFAESVKPTGAVNRYPAIGTGKEVFSYSVYMNGPIAQQLPQHLREHEFKDVMVHALTEKEGFNSQSFRDNLKISELVAIRSTWMSAVLENTMARTDLLTDQITSDYEKLTHGLTHPWIQEQLNQQYELMGKLQPTLDRASSALGVTITDRAPDEVSIGKVVMQDLDFTVQQTKDGRVVTHENRRLQDLPAVGSEVMVSYYRGSGQVVDSLENMKVSPPFIEPESGDLAVMIKDGKGKEQVILFNSVSSVEKFAKAHGMGKDVVQQAMDLRILNPKPLVPMNTREKTSDIYIDEQSGCLAVDYKEKGVQFSALFSNAQALRNLGSEFSLTEKDITQAKQYEARVGVPSPENLKASENELRASLHQKGFTDIQNAGGDRAYYGPVVADSAAHVAQDIGRKVAVIHDLRALDKAVAVGDMMAVKYENDRGRVSPMPAIGKSVER